MARATATWTCCATFALLLCLDPALRPALALGLSGRPHAWRAVSTSSFRPAHTLAPQTLPRRRPHPFVVRMQLFSGHQQHQQHQHQQQQQQKQQQQPGALARGLGQVCYRRQRRHFFLSPCVGTIREWWALVLGTLSQPSSSSAHSTFAARLLAAAQTCKTFKL